MTAADHVNLLRGLRAVCRFAPDPLPRHVVDDVLEVARWTGSASNRQPWEPILVRDKAMLGVLGGLDGAAGLRHVADAAVAIVLVPNGRLTDFDEGRLTERVLLAAVAHGLGAGVARVPAEHAATVAAVLGVPGGRVIRTMISLGYPADARAHLVSVERAKGDRQPLATMAVGRKPLAELVHVDPVRTTNIDGSPLWTARSRMWSTDSCRPRYCMSAPGQGSRTNWRTGRGRWPSWPWPRGPTRRRCAGCNTAWPACA
jgi:nitroreductase